MILFKLLLKFEDFVSNIWNVVRNTIWFGINMSIKSVVF